MAATKEQREIEIVMNGQKVNASLKEMGAAAALMNNQLRKMAADDPGREKLKNDFNAMRDRISGMKQELYGVEKASLAAKLGFSDMGGFMKTVMGTAGGFLVGGGIESVITKVVSFFSDASSGARELEHALDTLASITGASAEDLQFYEEQADVTGITVKRTADQVVEAYKLMGSAKPELLANRDALAATTEQALILANAAEMEVPDAVNALAGSLNQFGEGADQAGRYINVLAAGAKEGASEITETAAALKNSGTVAAAANVSFEQTNALIQSLSTVSIKGAEAGTGLRNFLLTLQSGADDTNPAIVGLETALDNLGKKNLSTAEMAKLFGKENVVVAQHLVKSKDEVTRLTEAVTGTSEATRQAEINMDNMDGALAELDVITKSYKDTIGKGLNVALTEAVKFLSAFLLILKEAPKFVRENKDLFIMLGAAIIALNWGNIKTTASTIAHTAAERARAVAVRASAIATRLLEAATKATPMGAFLAVVMALVAGFVLLYNRSEKVRAGVAGMGRAFMELLSIAGDIALFLLNPLKNAHKLAEIKNAGDRLGKAFSDGYNDKISSEKAEQEKKEEAEHQEAKQKAEEKGKDLGKATADGFATSLKGKSIAQLEAMLEEETDAAHKKLIQKQLKHLKEVEKNEKEHQEKVKKAREEYNQAVASSELENAKLKIELMEDGVDKVLAKLRFQHGQELKEIERHKADVLANVAATENEKQVLLDQYAEQQRMKEEALKLAEEEARAADREADQEKFFEQLEEEEEYQAVAMEEQFLRAFDAETAREQALLELHKQTLDQKLAYLQEAGMGETLEAIKIKNEILNIEKEKTDKAKALTKERADFERSMADMRLTIAGDTLDGLMGFMKEESAAYQVFKTLRKAVSLAEVMMNLEKEMAFNAVAAAANPLNAVTFGAAGATQLATSNTLSAVRAGFSVAKILAFEKGGMTKGGKTIPMAEVGGMWQMMSGYSGGSIGAFADGGWVNDAQLGLIGERGRELVLPNWMVESPKYANLIGYLEAERQKGVRAFADGGMTTGSAPALPNAESRVLSSFEAQLLQKFDELTEEVMTWPTRLEVHNNIVDTRDKIQQLNDLEDRAFG